MNLTGLSYFLKVAELEHMTQAAQELHLTQPALSRVISALEEELGCQLFERDGKRIRLNENGLILQRSAERIFLELESMQQQLCDAREGVTGTLRIGSSFPNREPDPVQGCIMAFAREYPHVAIHYLQYSPAQLLSELRSHRIDLAITSIPIYSVDVQYDEVFTEKLGLLIGTKHPLAQQEKISISQLRDERFYCNNSNTDTLDLSREFCHQAGFEPNIFFQGFFPELIGWSISQGSGVSFMVETWFEKNQRQSTDSPWADQLTFRPVVEDYCRRSCGIAYMKGGYLSRAARLFHEFFLKQLST